MKWVQSLTDYLIYQDQHYRNPAKLDNPVEIEDMDNLKRSGKQLDRLFRNWRLLSGKLFQIGLRRE